MAPPARHVPALDGLRGVAVAVVVAFHLGHLRGGWLGVDVFFVLSGFLITALLVRERDERGSIDLVSFWRRRALRLLPALALVMVAVAAYAHWWALPRELARLRTDALATLTYSTNWVSVAAHRGYWARYALPSPLEHTWSLAIEEQFYLLWPLVVLVVLGRRGRARTGRLLAVCAAGAAGLGGLAVVLFTHGADPSRLYAGTDTRAPALLAGAALAVLVHRHGPVRGRGARRCVALGGVAAAALLAVAMVGLDGQADLVYQGGLVVCSIAAALVIAAAIQPGRLGAALSARPLRALGTISYGVYLWHWPVIVVVRPPRVDLHGWPLLVVRLVLTAGAATASYVVVERPLRRDGLRAWRLPTLAPATGVATVCLVLVATTVTPVSAASIVPPRLVGAAGSAAAATVVAEPSTGAPGAPAAPSNLRALSEPAASASGTGDPAVVAIPLHGPILRPAHDPTRLMVVGDSVAHSIANAMTTLAGEQHLAVLDRGVPYCSLSYDANTWYRSKGGRGALEPRFCSDDVLAWPRDVAAFHPDAVLVLWGRAQIDDRLVDGRWLDPCDPAYLAWYRDLTSRSIRDLRSGGATVFIATAPPHRVFGLRNGDAGSACVNTMLRSAVSAAADPAVRLVDLDAWVCPQDRCVDKVDGVVLREEGLHFDNGGGIVAARWVLRQMFTASPVSP